MDWQRASERGRARRGSEADAEALLASAPPRRRASKAEMRAEAEAAIADWSQRPIVRRITCRGCGRKAEVTVPAAKLRTPLRCSSCRAVQCS